MGYDCLVLHIRHHTSQWKKYLVYKRGYRFQSNRVLRFSLGFGKKSCNATCDTTKFEWPKCNGSIKNKFISWQSIGATEPKPEIEAKFDCVGKRKKCKLHYMNCRTIKEKDNGPQSTEHCQVCGQSICHEHLLRICKKCLEK